MRLNRGLEINFNISAIIPIYNRANLVGRALDSVLAQSIAPQEIIVVDDGSTDGVETLLRENYPAVKYIRQENRGPSAARNTGIKAARGEWLAFLDSDDEWLPRKLEQQVAALKNNPQMKICYTNEIWIRNGRRVNQKKRHAKYGGYIYRQCLPLCIISPSSVIIHKDVFDEAGMFDESLPVCEDYDLWLRICSHWPVLYIDEPLITKYGGHDDQLSRKYWGMDRFRIKALEKMLLSDKLDKENRQATIQMILQKIKVLKSGAIKRKKTAEVQELSEKEYIYKNTFYT